MATIVYDDDDSHLTYTSVQPLQALGSIYFGGNGTCIATNADSTGLSVVFSGISISLFGWVSEDLPINVMLDGTIQSGVQFDAKEPKTINALYHFPNLSDTRHSLTIMPNNSSPSASGQCISVIDYVTVVAGENTSLDGKRLIVDESDPSVVFEGSWTPSNTAVLRTRFNSVVRRPYGNATRQTSSVNASATFHFNGTSVSVFGVNDLIPPESVTVSYNLDGDLTSQVYSFGNSTNFKWYHVDDLSPTVHELIMTLEDARNNASFNLDYIIYTPSFKPDPTPTPHGSGTTMSSTDHGVSHAALLGAIIGPIIFAAVVGILLVMRRKKLWFSRQRPNIVNPFRYRHHPTKGVSQTRIYHKFGDVNVQSVQTPIPDFDVPVIQRNPTPGELIHRLTRQMFARWSARIWRRTTYGTLEAFPSNLNPSENHRSIIQQKSALPDIHWRAAQPRGSGHSDTDTLNETIVADSRVQELEELVISLRQEIEILETRQAYGAQNGALMSEMVRSQNKLLNWRGRQGNSIHSSMAMSTTVV